MGLLYWLLVFVGSPAAILADPIAIVSAVIFIYSTDRANKLKGGGHQISQNALIKFTAIFGIMKIILMYYIAPQHIWTLLAFHSLAISSIPLHILWTASLVKSNLTLIIPVSLASMAIVDGPILIYMIYNVFYQSPLSHN
jgi:hypothetical protein